MPKNYWMLVVTPENFDITNDNSFTVQGFKTNLYKKVRRIEVGDRLLYYLSWVQKFAATATASSTYFEDNSEFWKSHKASEKFPYRIKIEASSVLLKQDFMDAREIAPRMEYVKKWIPETWPLAFQGELHLIPRKDFSLIEDEMQKIIRARS